MCYNILHSLGYLTTLKKQARNQVWSCDQCTLYLKKKIAGDELFDAFFGMSLLMALFFCLLIFFLYFLKSNKEEVIFYHK